MRQVAPTHFTLEQEILAAALGIAVVTGLIYSVGLGWAPFRRWRNRLRRGPGIRIAGEVIPDEGRLRHTHIVGATGSGKTVLLEQLIYRDLERGHGALIIDPKGDRELYERVRAFCRRVGRLSDLKLLSATHIDESVRWNPCRIGSASELQSKFYNSAVYSEPHYAKACELALLRAFNELTFKDSEASFTLADLVGQLDEISRQGKDETVAGLYLDLNNLVQGAWGSILGCGESGASSEVSLLDLTRRNEILFVDLPTEAQAVQSARVGRLLLQEVILISGLRKLYPHLRSKTPFSVFVDEFDAFAFPSFATFLNKGRSSDFMIHLAHQTLSDLHRVSETFCGQIMGNMNVRFIFRQDDPKDAEQWSKFFGTQRTIKRTFQTQDGQQTGGASNREVQEFRIAPDTIKELGIGHCILSIKTLGGPVRIKIPYSEKAMGPQLKFPVQRDPMDVAPKATRPDSVTRRMSELAHLVKENPKRKDLSL